MAQSDQQRDQNWRLKDWTRIACALVGIWFCFSQLTFQREPPIRETKEVVTAPPAPRTEKLVQVPSEPQTLNVAIFIAGAALILFAANGVRFFSVKTSVASADSEAPGEPASVENKRSEATQPPPDALVIERFLNLSSWYGLMLMKACTVAAAKQKALHLRALGKAGNQEVSFDYLYGYLIASISVGAVTGYTDPTSGILVNASVHKAVSERIDAFIAGSIKATPNETWKPADLAKFEAFLASM